MNIKAKPYDVVIVGAGVAGCVVANRLAAEGDRRILLVEAGGDFRTDMPPALRSGDFLPASRVPQAQWPGLTARRSQLQRPKFFLQGRGIGGTSLINGQIMLRPAVADFDAWAEDGCRGWSYRDVLPSLTGIENDIDFGTHPDHGDTGPIPIRRTFRDRWGTLDQGMAEWATGHGLPYVADHNSTAPPMGVSPYAFCARDGARVTAADAFLEDVRGQGRLEIRAETFAERVIVRRGRVVGLSVISGDAREYVTSDTVIVTAGALQSPALLLRSGIGPADELRESGIEVVANLPGVGSGLQDHPAVNVLFEYREAGTPGARPTNACIRFDAGLAGSEQGELFLNALDTVAEHGDGTRIGAIVLALFRPYGRGRVRLNGPGIDVDLDLLSSPFDLSRMVAGLAVLRDLVAHPALRALGAPLRASLPAVDSERELADWLKRRCHEAWHLAGTCRMGDPAADATVVDPDCRVVGVDGLLVMDASILPTVPRANTALVTMAAADHALRRRPVSLV